MSPLDSTLGAAFLGGLAAAILYGVTSVQTFLYFHGCRDGHILMGTVLFLWILDTVHLAFTAQGLYFYLITNFGDFSALQSPTWTILAGVYLTSVSDLIVRGFFSRRVFVLCRSRKTLSWVLPVVIMTISLVVFAFGFAFASKAFGLKTYVKMNTASALLYTSLGAAVAADTLIAASLCTLLLRSRTGFKRTDSLLTVLMMFSVNTGLLTSICAMGCMVTYAIWPERFIFLGFYFALSKLYVNSLLASLNARGSLQSEHTGSEGSTRFFGIITPIAFPTETTLPSSKE